MTATRNQHSTTRTQAAARPTAAGVLDLAFELGCKVWKLAFAAGPADNPRLRSIVVRLSKAWCRRSPRPRNASAWPPLPRCTVVTKPAGTVWPGDMHEPQVVPFSTRVLPP
jgi:hypothetical protein